MKTPSTRLRNGKLKPASVDSLTDLIGGLKRTISQRLTRQFRACVPVVVIRRAIEDAVEAAHETEFPHLFLPALAEEKVRLVSLALCEETVSSDLLHSAA